jgi:transcriptional antiterminator Rof (Rho-off)
LEEHPLVACACHLTAILHLQSPEKFQAVLAELAAAVEAERAQVEAADRRCRDLAVRRDAVGKVRMTALL